MKSHKIHFKNMFNENHSKNMKLKFGTKGRRQGPAADLAADLNILGLQYGINKSLFATQLGAFGNQQGLELTTKETENWSSLRTGPGGICCGSDKMEIVGNRFRSFSDPLLLQLRSRRWPIGCGGKE